MIPSLVRVMLVEVKYAAYCTMVSLLSKRTIFAPTPIGTPFRAVAILEKRLCFMGPEFSDAKCRRDSRQALMGSDARARRARRQM